MTVPPLHFFIFSYLEGQGFTVLPGSSIKYIRFNTKRPLWRYFRGAWKAGSLFEIMPTSYASCFILLCLEHYWIGGRQKPVFEKNSTILASQFSLIPQWVLMVQLVSCSFLGLEVEKFWVLKDSYFILESTPFLSQGILESTLCWFLWSLSFWCLALLFGNAVGYLEPKWIPSIWSCVLNSPLSHFFHVLDTASMLLIIV